MSTSVRRRLAIVDYEEDISVSPCRRSAVAASTPVELAVELKCQNDACDAFHLLAGPIPRRHFPVDETTGNNAK